jgi:tetratricopeptide (TPR) repeat protein
VLAYYQKEGTSDLPDAALLQRARALSLMGEVSNARGHLDESERLYTEAMAGTAEAVRRNPNDAQRIFEHAQNVFWVGDLARQRGQLPQAETRLRQYKSLADKMVALEPNNLKYRMEVEYAETDLGVVLYYERNFNEAERQFAAGLQTIQAAAGLVPNNGEYFKSVADSLAWLSDAEFAEGHIGDATGHRARQVALLQHLAKSTGDVRDREGLVIAQESLGRLLGVSGNIPAALEQLAAAVSGADAVVPTEPTNRGWTRDAAAAKLAYAEFLFASGKKAEASVQADSASSLANRLVATDRSAVDFQVTLRNCLLMQAQIALSAHNYAAAGAFANRALTVARSIHSPDAGDDRFQAIRAQRLVGDVEQATGNLAAAQDSWRNAEQQLPSNGAERPRDMVQRMILLQRLHHDSQAQQIADNLRAMGYHWLEF